MSLAIACASGCFRVAFVQGVLSAFERANLRADAYAGTSGTVIPAALAASGQHDQHGLAYITGLLDYQSGGLGMSGVFLESIRAWSPLIRDQLGQRRLIIPVSAVMTPEAGELTQGKAARRLGRQLLLATARHDNTWSAAHLRLELFDTHAANPDLRLFAGNFDAVAYASSRMLHAWETPAEIDGRAYIDGSYTCSCPALELADMGYDEVIAISPECGAFYHDLFGTSLIPPMWHGTPIHAIQPDMDVKTLGVDYTQATKEGVLRVYQHGEEKGRAFLSAWRRTAYIT
ncbi:MAG: hypothetical protein IAE80_01525 [Anaerolinea sp.]|nr:hypothetical protein [Anaerolinea sp.]